MENKEQQNKILGEFNGQFSRNWLEGGRRG